MGLPKRLTDMQKRFAEFYVFGGESGPMTKTEAATAAGYSKDNARHEGSTLTNPKLFPLVVKYIGELREESQRKHEVTYENHIAELGRPKGFKQNNPKEDDKTKTANPSTELFQRFVQGRTGRPLAYADAQKEIPDLTKRRYANYLNFLYNNPDPLGKATGGFIKTTRENLQGNPEARFLGYPVCIPAVGGVIGGLAGARTAIMTSPDIKISVGEGQVATTQGVLPKLNEQLPKSGQIKPEKLLSTPKTGKGKARLIGRAMGGGLAGSVPGILAGKLINQALARSENDKASSLAGSMNPYK